MSATSLRNVRDLVDAGLAPACSQQELTALIERFSLAVTPAMTELIDRSDPHDPIAGQFIPQRAELDMAPEEMIDPTDDVALSPIKGIVHRYPDRVLLKPAHVCPVYCRFCFRREQVGPGSEALSPVELAAALRYIAERPQIWEVVVSGGDPWMLSARRIKALVHELGSIPHVGVIRFHTRIPIVDPERVTDDLVHALESEKSVWVVIHTNHAQELTAQARQACRKLRLAGVPLLSQSVLLKGINDDVAVLTELFRSLVAIGVKPYYLHHGDLARGTSHFRTSIETGQEIMRQLRGRVSGLCQPTYVLDIPNARGKVPIGPSYATRVAGAPAWNVEDIDGNLHAYPPASSRRTPS